MRLHELSVTAFGPFGGTSRVAFDELHDAGLFLLSGATGAGKTSLLDAVVFALYGVVPGARQAASRLRSDHAAPGVVPEVRLEFTCRDRRLRVTRSPAWDRPKKRGTAGGTVREQARVLLEEVGCDGARRVLATRLDEAGHLLRDVVGMSPEQFCQVVLLPQGEFARFLRADADTRRAVLQTLFATERFGAAESLLVDRRRASARELELLEQELEVLRARVGQAAGGLAEALAGSGPEDAAPEDAAPEDGGPEDGEREDGGLQQDPQEWSRAVAARAREAADAAAVALRTARSLAARALQSRDEGRALAAEVTAARALDERRRAVAAARAIRDDDAAELAAARRAEAVGPLLDAHARAVARAAASSDAEGGARAALPTGLRDLSAAALRTRARHDRDEVARLRDLLAEVGVDALRNQVTAAAEDEQRLVRRRDALRGTRDAVEAGRAGDEATVAAANEAATRVVALEPELTSLTERLTAARRRDALTPEHARAVAAGLRLERLVLDAREALLDARAARLAGIAAELAARLVPDAPCPVCGSEQHPAPAPGPTVAAADEEAAQARLDRAEADRDAGARRLRALGEEVAAAAAGSGGEAVVVLEARHAEASAALASARASVAAGGDAAERVAAAGDDLDRLAAELAGLDGALAALSLRRQTLVDQVTAAEARLAGARGDDISLDARLARLDTRATAAERAADLADAAVRAVGQLREAAAERESAVRTAGFASTAEAGAARRAPGEVAGLEERLRAYDEEAARVGERLADPAMGNGGLEALLALPDPDVAGAEREALAAQASAERAAADDQVARRRTQELEQLTLLVDDVADRLAPARVDHATVDRLSRLVDGSSGDNALRMRLSAFVLAARLEQVAAAASERLHRMTSGRYTLRHTDGAAGGRGRSGLGLAVIDAWTGVERDPATLSGGEAFCASLALALGLADVVTAEAGGALIETLFVDEGFGSLDEESLDEVLDVLDGLREGGRAVGVVSHVAELRTRIPAQVRVEKRRHGSAVAVVGIVAACGDDAAPSDARTSAA